MSSEDSSLVKHPIKGVLCPRMDVVSCRQFDEGYNV